MTLKTRPVRLSLLSLLSAPLAGAKINAQLSLAMPGGEVVVPSYEIDGTDVVPLVVALTEDPVKPGDYVGDFWPNTRGSKGTRWLINVAAGELLMKSLNLTVVDGNSDVEVPLSVIVDAPPYPQVFPSSQVVSAAQGYADAAGESASRAANISGQFGSLDLALEQIEESRFAAVTAADQAVPAAAEAVAASISASAVANRHADTTEGLLATAELGYFTTPSTVLGEAAIIWRKVGGAAVDTLIRLPSTGLMAVMLPRESGYAWALVDSLNRAAMLVGLDGKVTIPSIDNRLVPLELLPVQITSLTTQSTSMATQLATLSGLTSVAMAPESGYAWALVDSNQKAAMLVALDGRVIIPKLVIGAGAVSRATLDPALDALFPMAMPVESGYAWALVDSLNRVGLGIKLDGTVVGKFPGQTIAAGTIVESMLSGPLVRQAVPHVTDVVSVRPDEWRGNFGAVAVRTSTSGSLWEPFPGVLTPLMRGVVAGTAALHFRKSARLLIRGKRDCGTFTPGAVASTTYKANFNSATAWPPAGSFAAGDYYLYNDAVTRVIGASTVGRSDILVYDGAAWQYQASPTALGGGGPTTRLMRDWWTLSAAGTFDGVTYAVGDRIVNLGFQSQSGYGIDRWYKGDSTKGELFYKGEFDAAAGSLPASPSDGLLWQASSAGAAGGITFAIGDYLIRESGAWGQVPTEPFLGGPVGGFVNLNCISHSDEWEVRRQDKGTARVGVQLNVRKASAPRRWVDKFLALSDSMYGVSSVGALIIGKIAREGVVKSFGGGTSSDVRAMMEREIAVNGDLYRGWLLGLWIGQNNQPTLDLTGNAATLRSDILATIALVGARDAHFFIKSILGQRIATWNGARIVVAQHEDMFNKTGALYAHEQWLAAMFPGQWFSPRVALLAAAGSTPDPTFPGMTERQVADTYGVAPFSFFLGAPSIPVAAASLVYQGAWSTAGLPTGGAANDYYIRTANGTVGSLLVNNAGTWVEPSLDLTHLSPAGAEALATFEANFITSNYW